MVPLDKQIGQISDLRSRIHVVTENGTNNAIHQAAQHVVNLDRMKVAHIHEVGELEGSIESLRDQISDALSGNGLLEVVDTYSAQITKLIGELRDATKKIFLREEQSHPTDLHRVTETHTDEVAQLERFSELLLDIDVNARAVGNNLMYNRELVAKTRDLQPVRESGEDITTRAMEQNKVLKSALEAAHHAQDVAPETGTDHGDLFAGRQDHKRREDVVTNQFIDWTSSLDGDVATLHTSIAELAVIVARERKEQEDTCKSQIAQLQVQVKSESAAHIKNCEKLEARIATQDAELEAVKLDLEQSQIAAGEVSERADGLGLEVEVKTLTGPGYKLTGHSNMDKKSLALCTQQLKVEQTKNNILADVNGELENFHSELTDRIERQSVDLNQIRLEAGEAAKHTAELESQLEKERVQNRAINQVLAQSQISVAETAKRNELLMPFFSDRTATVTTMLRNTVGNLTQLAQAHAVQLAAQIYTADEEARRISDATVTEIALLNANVATLSADLEVERALKAAATATIAIKTDEIESIQKRNENFVHINAKLVTRIRTAKEQARKTTEEANVTTLSVELENERVQNIVVNQVLAQSRISVAETAERSELLMLFFSDTTTGIVPMLHNTISVLIQRAQKCAVQVKSDSDAHTQKYVQLQVRMAAQIAKFEAQQEQNTTLSATIATNIEKMSTVSTMNAKLAAQISTTEEEARRITEDASEKIASLEARISTQGAELEEQQVQNTAVNQKLEEERVHTTTLVSATEAFEFDLRQSQFNASEAAERADALKLDLDEANAQVKTLKDRGHILKLELDEANTLVNDAHRITQSDVPGAAVNHVTAAAAGGGAGDPIAPPPPPLVTATTTVPPLGPLMASSTPPSTKSSGAIAGATAPTGASEGSGVDAPEAVKNNVDGLIRALAAYGPPPPLVTRSGAEGEKWHTLCNPYVH
jgi:hypothetical protein